MISIKMGRQVWIVEVLRVGSVFRVQAAAASWEQHTRGNKELSANTIVPICESTQNQASATRDLLEREVSAFHRSPDNRSYMMPATAQVHPPRFIKASAQNLLNMLQEAMLQDFTVEI